MVYFVWEPNSRGGYSPSLWFGLPPAEFASCKHKLATMAVHPVTDPAMLARIDARDGSGPFGALALAFPAPLAAAPGAPVAPVEGADA